MKKRLYKDRQNEKLCGVCAGIAKYFSIDPTLVRLGLIAFCALGGSGVLAYIVCALVIPDEPDQLEGPDNIVDV